MSLEKPGWNGSEKEMATGAGEDVEENCATGGGSLTGCPKHCSCKDTADPLLFQTLSFGFFQRPVFQLHVIL